MLLVCAMFFFEVNENQIVVFGGELHYQFKNEIPASDKVIL